MSHYYTVYGLNFIKNEWNNKVKGNDIFEDIYNKKGQKYCGLSIKILQIIFILLLR